MKKERKVRLEKLMKKISEIRDEVEQILLEEENFLERLEGKPEYEDAVADLDLLSDVVAGLDDAVDTIDSVLES